MNVEVELIVLCLSSPKHGSPSYTLQPDSIVLLCLSLTTLRSCLPVLLFFRIITLWIWLLLDQETMDSAVTLFYSLTDVSLLGEKKRHGSKDNDIDMMMISTILGALLNLCWISSIFFRVIGHILLETFHLSWPILPCEITICSWSSLAQLYIFKCYACEFEAINLTSKIKFSL